MVISTLNKQNKQLKIKQKQNNNNKNNLPHIPLYDFFDQAQRQFVTENFFPLYTSIMSLVLMQLHNLHRKLFDSVVRIPIRQPVSKHVYSVLIDSPLACFSAQCIFQPSVKHSPSLKVGLVIKLEHDGNIGIWPTTIEL